MVDQAALMEAWGKVKSVVADLRAENGRLKDEINALKSAPPVVVTPVVDPSVIDMLAAEMDALVGVVSAPPVVVDPVIEPPSGPPAGI